ncbi:MAG: right-handed parallel beta-helix repeat-containing protein [Deltaproteobacteria bacterium]|nr:right-handed parallel beta-helix repeat-containing protein [Deltaproteobacteria bacterium]
MPCTSCHWHSASFKPRHLSAGHAVHIDANTRCPKLDCGACHDVEDVPNFKSGDDANGDGKYNLAETDVCNTCHSPGGSYNGVNADSRSVGAKNEWFTGVYTGDTLQPGKEKWCAGCHDESPSTINGVSAPNVIGNESASTGYGIGYGFYKTGHGLEGGIYPTSGAPAAKLTCAACHDFSTTHIDGDARTYVAASNNYQAGYRLKSVNGGRPMNIPRSGNTTPASDFAICMQCHESAPRIDSGNMQTNFRETVGSTHNSHAYHLNGAFTNKWDSDWDGSTAESRQSCPACHNVHGSPSMAMGRHGELISTPGTTDKVPALDYRYTPGSFPTLAESTGGEMAFRGRGNVAESGVCVMCHRGTGYTRTPIDLYPPTILGAYAKTLGTQVHVIFSEAVYTSPSQTGAIIPGDLTLTDIDNGRTIIAVSHSAGDSRGTLTLSSALDAVDDIDVDTLAAASTTSIYDGADLAMNIGTVTIEADDDGPDASNLFPANGATFVSGFTPLTFTLTDPKSNVDWSTFSVTITGTAYNKTYTDLDTTVVSKTGPASAYAVTIIPDQSFPCSTTMTVVLHANDYLGNAMISPAWTFDTIPWANLPPVLSWTRELVAYNIDGVKPSHGEINTSFTFRVKYTDLDNNAPTVMTLWIDGSSYTMSEADSGDQTFTDGKIYTRTLTLGTAGTFAYHFSASDGTDAATGEPTSNTDVEVITAAHALNVPSEYATISAAVTAVSDVDDTILVAAGTYTGQVYISKEVQLRSLDDAENTILTNIDNREVFFNHAKASTLDGFTLDGQNGVGRGIYSENDSWPTILNCIIVRHHGDHGLVVGGANTVSVINTTFSDNIGGSGGAIYGNNNGTHIIATYCTFDNNAATSIRGGAVFLNTGVDGTFTRCTFNNNTAPSAGAIGTSSTSIVTIVGCTFTNNTATTGGGGAIYLNSTGQISIETSVFTGNEAVSGAAITLNMHTTMTMTNCTLTGNNASTYAGAIYFNTTDSTTIHSCTFSGNEANLGGALYFINGGTKTITNSIFYGDWSRNSNENEIMTNGAAYPTVTYCNISQTDFIGDNNFPDDPLFLDPKSHTLAPTSTGDYHVNPVSPCLEKGTSTNAPTTDIDGETRPQNGGYDVGSDEKVLPPC